MPNIIHPTVPDYIHCSADLTGAIHYAVAAGLLTDLEVGDNVPADPGNNGDRWEAMAGVRAWLDSSGALAAFEQDRA